MASKAKRDIRRLLASGKLSGWQAGILVLRDNVEVDHGRPGILKPGDMEAIKTGLQEREHILDYNALVNLYRAIAMMSLDAKILGYESVENIQRLQMMSSAINRQMERLLLAPQIITEAELPAYRKQRKKVEKLQREDKLSDEFCLDYIIEARAFRMAPEEEQQRHKSSETLRAEDPELYEQLRPQAIREIRELIDAGRIMPSWYEEDRAEVEPLLRKVSEEAGGRYEIDWQRMDELPAEQRQQLEERAYIEVRELYEAKLPEVVEYVEEFYRMHQYRDPKAQATADKYTQMVAVLQDPEPWEMDEGGHYNQVEPPQLFVDIQNLQAMGEVDKQQDLAWLMHHPACSTAETPKEAMILKILDGAEIYIRAFMGYRAILEMLSKYLEVDFTEDVEERYGQLQIAIIQYQKSCNILNLLADRGSHLNERIQPGGFLKACRAIREIHIEQLTPTEASRQKIGEAIHQQIKQAGWWPGELKELVEFPDGYDLTAETNKRVERPNGR